MATFYFPLPDIKLIGDTNLLSQKIDRFLSIICEKKEDFITDIRQTLPIFDGYGFHEDLTLRKLNLI